MASNTDGYDYGTLSDLIIDQIKKITGCEAVETDYSGTLPAYPFFSFDYTTPHIQIVRQMNDGEIFEVTVSINCHAEVTTTALQLSSMLSKNLQTKAVRQIFRDQAVVIVDIDSAGRRDLFQITDYERIVGFDLHLRVQDDFEEELIAIDKLNVDGKSVN